MPKVGQIVHYIDGSTPSVCSAAVITGKGTNGTVTLTEFCPRGEAAIKRWDVAFGPDTPGCWHHTEYCNG